MTRHNLEVVRGMLPWHARISQGLGPFGWSPLALLAVALVLVAAVAGGALAYQQFTGDEDDVTTTTTPGGTVLVVVPDVVGDPVGDARAELEDAGFEVSEERAFSDEEDAGVVVEQDPPEGTEVEEGSLVALTVSAGPEPVVVPDVTGLPEERALGVLEGAGLEGSVAERVYSNDVEAGLVIAQNPDGGTKVPPGSDVEITVSMGPPPDLAVTIEEVDQDCSQGPCVVTVRFTVKTTNDAAVPEPFDVLIEVTPEFSETIEVEGLDAGKPEVLSETLETGENCFDPDPVACVVRITVDPEESLPDPNRENNEAEHTETAVP